MYKSHSSIVPPVRLLVTRLLLCVKETILLVSPLPFALVISSLFVCIKASRSQRAGQENSEALPNPWGGGATNQQQNSQPSSTGSPASGGFGSVLGSSGMNSLMEQMLADPAMMQSLMRPEMMELFRQSISQNPQIMEQNPLVANNPQLAEQLRAQLPNMMNMMGNPEIMAAMTNPRVLEALRMIQQGMDTIRREAPALAGMFGSSFSAAASAAGAAAGGTGGTGAARNTESSNNQDPVNMLNNILFVCIKASRSQRAGQENSEALPNPWGGGATNQQQNSQPSSTGSPASGGFGSVLGSSGMNSLMEQMLADPAMMQSLMRPEMMELFRQSISQNPQIMEQNPLVANNPQLAEQLRAQLPNMMNMMGNPEIMAAMTNPRVLEALRMIQQGMDTIRREAPALAGSEHMRFSECLEAVFPLQLVLLVQQLVEPEVQVLHETPNRQTTKIL
ncbi:hypothetical protein NECAME_11557 [Necator americanus]|uniref:STI1 domain-containing protein n=1 Tax=Necator americanus TaxID=51031 RepID=W2T6I6_NECAM|nr:hypothetical protein NECAME_11557 [Necator americanus]ETN76607.1 hypothetical protein NECAME_11557 [Necator americanus]